MEAAKRKPVIISPQAKADIESVIFLSAAKLESESH
jgi:hypothetical protein